MVLHFLVRFKSHLQHADDGTLYKTIWNKMSGIQLSANTTINLQRVEKNKPPYGYMADSTILQYQVSQWHTCDQGWGLIHTEKKRTRTIYLWMIFIAAIHTISLFFVVTVLCSYLYDHNRFLSTNNVTMNTETTNNTSLSVLDN